MLDAVHNFTIDRSLIRCEFCLILLHIFPQAFNVVLVTTFKEAGKKWLLLEFFVKSSFGAYFVAALITKL